MMYNTRYLPENFDQCRLEKTILRQFPYNLSVRSSWNALIQDGGKYHEKAYVYYSRRSEIFIRWLSVFRLHFDMDGGSPIYLTSF